MPIIAVLNPKGGSGKSTLATTLAVWYAKQGHSVMLGDVDRQQSVRGWLSRRDVALPNITTWMLDQNKTFRAKPGTTHVVLDTPGALYGHDRAKLLVWVDIIVVPIGPSIFDQEASLAFLQELQSLPRIRSGRCSVVAVGMRWPIYQVRRWYASGQQWKYPLLTVIPENTSYPAALEQGRSVLDSQDNKESLSFQHVWDPLFLWLEQAASPTHTLSAPKTLPSTITTLEDLHHARSKTKELALAPAVKKSEQPPPSSDSFNTVDEKVVSTNVSGQKTWWARLIKKR